MSEQTRNKVFISYSHKDKKWMQKLKTMLHPLISKGKIIPWDDSNIKTGQKWHDEIINALDTSKIAVLLVSDNFLASEYITNVELPEVIEAAEKGECTICWIPISHCLIKEFGLDKYQAAHDINFPLDGLPPSEVKKALAEVAEEINRIYIETAIKPTATVKKLKQIKILSIIASPEYVDDIYYEREQDAMLEAFKSFDREEVFLDMPDPVKSTLTEIKDHLENGKHDILHITAHGGINKKGEGILSLEDQWGKLDEATGKKLLKFLVPAPRIVILSACHSARKETDLMPVARVLFKDGIDIVIGMKTQISHAAAIEFNLAFFKALCQKNTVKEAFQQGKDAIFQSEQKRTEELPNWDAIREYEIPQLLVRKKDENLTRKDFSDHRIEAPDRPESHHFMGAKYLERGFIGRRQVLRDIYKSIENKEGAIVLKGPGGIGKSTLTTRAAVNLVRKNYDFIVVRGETTIEQILEAISKKAAAKGVKKANEVFEENIDVEDKLVWYLDNFLLKQKIVIIFDNFEENQDEKKEDFHKSRLKEFLWFFRDALKNKETFLFFSTRYKLVGFDCPEITIEIPEFSSVEFRKMLGKSNALKRLNIQSVKNLRQEIGGNPRTLELLDQIAYKEFKMRDFTWVQLKDLIPELQERIFEKKGTEDDFTPLFLDKLFSYLTDPQRQVLDILSIYRNPVPVDAITVHDVKMERLDRIRLADLSLLGCFDIDEKSLYYVHRLTAQYSLKQMKQAVKTRYHLRAAQYFEGVRTNEGKKNLENEIEARQHYIQAKEWNKAADITFNLKEYLTLYGFPKWSLELLRGLEVDKLNEENQIITYGNIGELHSYFGENDKAILLYKKVYEVAVKNNDIQKLSTALNNIGVIYENIGDYDAALKHFEKALQITERHDIKGNASSLHNIGNIYYYKGDYDAALKYYQHSIEIKERIVDIKGIAISLHQIGIIYQEKGNYDAALKKYEKALEISEKIVYIKGVSDSLHQIGIIYQEKGDYDTALKKFKKSLEIRVNIEDIKGTSESLYVIGNIYLEKGDYDESLKKYNESLGISEKIGDMLGVAKSLHNIGIVYQNKGDYETALIKYEKAKEIFEKVGFISGVSSSLNQIGNIYKDKGDYDAALIHYEKSLEIWEKIGDISGISGIFHNIGIIYQNKGNYELALKQYERSLEIREKIGDIKGVSSSLNQIGSIYQEKGDYDAALKQYKKSLEISEKIGDIPGAAISMHQMGTLHFQKKEFEIALEYFIPAFLVFTKIGSPKVKQTRENIAITRKKLSEEKFHAILKKFNLKPETLAGDPKKQLFDLLAVVTSQAFSVKEKSSQEKEKIAAQVNEMINKLPEDKPEIEGIKSYIQMLLAFVNGEDVQTYMEKIPEELKEMFEKMRKKI